MDRDFIIRIISENFKNLRRESHYTQDKMAEIVGVSKKTIIQIEKGRGLADWTTCIAICAIFRESDILHKIFGGDPLEVIEITVQDVNIRPQEKTMGGHIMWKNITEYKGFKLQRNVISKHFRILDEENYRLISTFNEDVAHEMWQDIQKTI
ncbi:helix-turn-helix transcriptional regulator [Ureibacillus chungkukjangi]|uniref:Xre family transcriptional regulator n=1 Tax=Ureibacillus chungkukjangi TaxID=1202712 RepID=A0A318TYS7_9BACL|nr:helix-turn-helix domain-containing protein [Ureibacillus chungkukjangi]PYF07255.1 Xre family transcriptional regulator [Ureibacillus chungkukjangi]